jgi:[ribosomal protein S5]-alanine N-acetyltransferase
MSLINFQLSQSIKLVHLNQVKAYQCIAYYLKNLNHLKNSMPKPCDDFYTLKYWQNKIKYYEKELNQDSALRFVLMDNKLMIGQINFSQIIRGGFQACYLGFGIDCNYQKRGLMTNALTMTIDYLFNEKSLHRIMANYMPANSSSGRLLKRLGFKQEGYARDYLNINGQWEDHILMSLHNED